MKMFSMFCALAIFAMSSVALANDSDFARFQEDVVVGEEDPAQVAAPEAYEGAPVESYGYAPGWTGGCCDHGHGHHAHLWDNYCAEKHCGWFGHRSCGKTFGGCGGFNKGCCEPKCGRRWHLPKICLPKLHLKDRCCQKAKCCKATICHKASCCRKFHLPKLRLFSRKGCCSKCGKGGTAAGGVIYEGPAEVNEVPAPAMDINEVPMPPMDLGV